MNIASAAVENGNKTVQINVTGESAWEKEGSKRVYFEVSHSDKKRLVIDKLYEVMSGSTRDDSMEVAGRVFAYQLGVCVDSKTKRAKADEAVAELVAQIVKASPAL